MFEHQKEHYLSFLDQQPHIRNFGRHLTIFPFPDARCADQAVAALRNGLAAMLDRFPSLAGVIHPPDAGSGNLKLTYSLYSDSAHEAQRILNQSYAVAMHPRFLYNTLLHKHFDPSCFPAEVFCPALLRLHPGLDDNDPYATATTSFAKRIPLPVMAAQATFIPGGLVLSTWVHHCVADGAGSRKMFEVWSHEVRSREDSIGVAMDLELDMIPAGEHDDSLPRIESLCVAKALDDLAQASTLAPLVEVLVLPNNEVTFRGDSYSVGAKHIRFADSIIRTLSKDLSVSPFTALAALLWAHIIQARNVVLKRQKISLSTLAVVVDLRTRLGPPFTAPDYLGNCVLSAKPTCNPASSLQSADCLKVSDIAPLAKSIAQSLASFDAPAITSRLAVISSSTTTPPMIDCQDLRFANGPDLYITDWRHIGMDNEWCIPGTSSSKPTAMRRACWKGEGGIVILPKVKGEENVWEAMVSLEKNELNVMEQSLQAGGWLLTEDSKEHGVERARL